MSDLLVQEPLYIKLKNRLTDYIQKEKPRLLPCEKDLMKHYGVSRNTVRRVVFELTKDKILKPVQGLGTLVYPQPEISDNSIILVIYDKHLYPFQQEIFNELMATLNDYRLNTMLTIIDKDNLDVDRIEFLLQKADGVIIDQMASFSMKIHELIKSLRKKCVCLRWKPDVYDENYVAEDLVAGFYKVARSLLDAGHRQIAYLGRIEDDKRMAGIRQAFGESGIEIDSDLCVDFMNGTRHVGYTAAEELMRRGKKFTAIISHNDDAALGIMERLLIAGLRIPDDVSIAGFDNISDSANFPVPLTTCGGNNRQLINAVISLLLNNHSSDIKKAIIIEPEMVFRSSIRKI